MTSHCAGMKLQKKNWRIYSAATVQILGLQKGDPSFTLSMDISIDKNI